MVPQLIYLIPQAQRRHKDSIRSYEWLSERIEAVTGRSISHRTLARVLRQEREPKSFVADALLQITLSNPVLPISAPMLRAELGLVREYEELLRRISQLPSTASPSDKESLRGDVEEFLWKAYTAARMTADHDDPDRAGVFFVAQRAALRYQDLLWDAHEAGLVPFGWDHAKVLQEISSGLGLSWVAGRSAGKSLKASGDPSPDQLMGSLIKLGLATTAEQMVALTVEQNGNPKAWCKILRVLLNKGLKKDISQLRMVIPGRYETTLARNAVAFLCAAALGAGSKWPAAFKDSLLTLRGLVEDEVGNNQGKRSRARQRERDLILSWRTVRHFGEKGLINIEEIKNVLA